jgi:succinyl-CoA synthetase beta subunit
MKIHEYQTKEILARFGVPTPRGQVAESVEAVAEIAARAAHFPLVVKAQIHAGGRGKGGGVKVVLDRDQAVAAAESILGMQLVTPQTGPQGQRVGKVLLEEGVAIRQEIYLSLVVDRAQAAFTFLASAAGGMAIEEVAAHSPELLVRVTIDPLSGLSAHHLRQLAFGLGLDSSLHKEFFTFCQGLYRMFSQYDCLILEINPLAVTQDGRLLALDAKVEFDDNALFRHPELLALADPAEEPELEHEARALGLNYIGLDGTIGTMVNGAGLAMATMDLIKQAGAAPANFLDVGGGASAEMVAQGLRIILKHPTVQAIFINIFGGILRCDLLAQGVVAAARQIDIQLPVIVRMEGTNCEEGRRLLAASGLNLHTVPGLAEAAVAIAALVHGGRS